MAERKEAYYFSHDSNARHDIKVMAMRSIYQSEGYGWYWMLVEMMREQTDYKLCISGKYDLQILATELNTEPIKVKKFIDDCVKEFTNGDEKGLFQSDSKYIWSDSLNNRMDMRRERQTAGARGGKAKAETQFDSDFQTAFDYWNKMGIIKHEIKPRFKDAYIKARKEWTAKEILTAIYNYTKVLKDKNSYFKHEWTFDMFMTRKNAITQFVNDSSVNNYKSDKKEVGAMLQVPSVRYNSAEPNDEKLKTVTAGMLKNTKGL